MKGEKGQQEKDTREGQGGTGARWRGIQKHGTQFPAEENTRESYHVATLAARQCKLSQLIRLAAQLPNSDRIQSHRTIINRHLKVAVANHHQFYHHHHQQQQLKQRQQEHDQRNGTAGSSGFCVVWREEGETWHHSTDNNRPSRTTEQQNTWQRRTLARTIHHAYTYICTHETRTTHIYRDIIHANITERRKLVHLFSIFTLNNI